jgi:hypothetical protein
LKKPYQPVAGSDWQYGQLPTGGTGTGGGGTSPTPNGTDPFATGVTGTPVEFIAPPPIVDPPAPPEEPDFSNWVPGRPATPSDLIVPGTPPEFDIDPDTQTSIEVVEGDIASDYSGLPITVGSNPEMDIKEPDTQTSIEVVEGDIASDYSGLPIIGGVPADMEKPAEPETQTSLEVVEGDVASDYTGIPIIPVGSNPEMETKEPETQTSLEVVEGDVASDYSGLPISTGTVGELVQPKENEGTVTVEEIDEQAVADDIRNRLSQDFGGPPVAFPSGYKPVEFDQPDFNIEVEEVPDQEPAAEEDKGITKEDIKNAGMRIAEQALRNAFPMAGLVYDVYKELTEKKEPEGKVTVEEVKEGEKESEKEAPKEEEAKSESEERADIEYTPSKASGASFMNIGLGQERMGLAKAAAGSEFEDSMPEGQITIEELGMAGGGMIPRFSQGGIGSLQQYAVGGKLLNGAGDGMSDDIKANINGTQEARLADGEFVIPADVVSHLGNGSTDAGAKQLYAMMDRIRKARTGRTKQAPEVEARKYMPA